MDKQTYEKKVHFFGRISVFIFMIGTIILPLTLFLKFGILPERTAFLAGASTVLSIMILVSLAEFLSYAPIIGSAGMYMLQITGNTSNIKIPASIAAMEATGFDPVTEEGEIISTLSIGISTLTTEIVILSGVFLLAPFGQVFQNPALKPAFEQIVPALFGALIASSIIKNWKLSVVPIIFAFIVTYLISQPFGTKLEYFSIPIMIIVTLIFNRIAYNTGMLTPINNVKDIEAQLPLK
jgi:hypothetical protein